MVGEIEINGTDLDKPAYKAYYPLAKHVYQDDGEIVPENIASDKQILLILCAKIMAILVDDLPTNKSRQSILV